MAVGCITGKSQLIITNGSRGSILSLMDAVNECLCVCAPVCVFKWILCISWLCLCVFSKLVQMVRPFTIKIVIIFKWPWGKMRYLVECSLFVCVCARACVYGWAAHIPSRLWRSKFISHICQNPFIDLFCTAALKEFHLKHASITGWCSRGYIAFA